jgi:hypothetical protein
MTEISTHEKFSKMLYFTEPYGQKEGAVKMQKLFGLKKNGFYISTLKVLRLGRNKKSD